jgi:hypothetical protein
LTWNAYFVSEDVRKGEILLPIMTVKVDFGQ